MKLLPVPLLLSVPLVVIALSVDAIGADPATRLDQVNCVLKLAKLPTITKATRILGDDMNEALDDANYVITFEGTDSEPASWWNATPAWVQSEAADWESCAVKGNFSDTAACLELEDGYLAVETEKKRITVVVSQPSEESKRCK